TIPLADAGRRHERRDSAVNAAPPRPAPALHHGSMHGRFFFRRFGRGGDDANAVVIQRRESAGSITSSISKCDAALTALPWRYLAPTIAWKGARRSLGSVIAASSFRNPSFTAPSSPMPPNSPVGHATVKRPALKLPPAIAIAPSP